MIFRRPLLLLAVIVVLPVISLAIVRFLPRSYQAEATLWALRRYEVIGATGPESNQQATPAETQATALSEVLQSRSFALSVANATDLASTLDPGVRGNAELRDDALFAEVSQHVQVGAQGYNLYVITYTNHNPVVAQQVVKAVIDSFGLQSQGFSLVEGQRLLEGYQTELAKVKDDATKAAAAESKYIATHPYLSKEALLTDPQYALLHAQTQQTQVTLTNIQNTIATISQEISVQGQSAQSFFKVLDAPKIPDRATSLMKTYLMAGGIGLGAGLLACALYIVIGARRDRTIYTPHDLQKVTALPLIMQLPYLTSTALPLVVEPVAHEDDEAVLSL